MDGVAYLRGLMDGRLAAIRGPEPDATALFTFELRGAADALVAAGELDGSTARRLIDEWNEILESEGFVERREVGTRFHGRAEASDIAHPSSDDDRDADAMIDAFPVDEHLTVVDGVRLRADGVVRYRHGFELRLRFEGGASADRHRLLERMTTRDWRWTAEDRAGTAYRETSGHGGLGAYTIRFHPGIPTDAHELTVGLTEDAQPLGEISIVVP